MAFLRVLLIILLVGGVGAGTYFGVARLKKQEQAAGASQQGGGSGRPGGAPAAPLPVQVVEVQPEVVEYTMVVVGSLVAGESVAITSEQSLRLRSIHVEEGQRVAEGQLLFELDDSDLVFRMRQLEAEFEQARLAEKRLAELLASNSTSPAAYDEARARLGVINAQIDQVKNQILKTKLKAPFAGRVGIRQVSVGAWVTPQDVLTTLQDTDRIKVDLKVPERYAPFVSPGQVIRFRTEASAREGEAKVVAIEPSIERETRSLVVRALAENHDGFLLPGSFVTATLTLRSERDALMVPTQAITPSTTGSTVFVVQEGKARPRTVRMGLRTADRVRIAEGLQPGDQVIISNLLRVRPGSDVQPELVAPIPQP